MGDLTERIPRGGVRSGVRTGAACAEEPCYRLGMRVRERVQHPTLTCAMTMRICKAAIIMAWEPAMLL